MKTPSIFISFSRCEFPIFVIIPISGLTIFDKYSISPFFAAPASKTIYLLSFFDDIMLIGSPISLLKFLIVDEHLGSDFEMIFVVDVFPLLPVINIFFPLKSDAISDDIFESAFLTLGT